MKRVRIVMLWVLTVAVAVLMIGPGAQKFTGPTWERMFRVWGYPEHFYLLIGAIEVIGGLGLLVPRAASASAVILMVVMAGASATQFLHARNGRSGAGEIVFMVLLGIVAYCRWPGWLARRAGHAPATASHGVGGAAGRV